MNKKGNLLNRKTYRPKYCKNKEYKGQKETKKEQKSQKSIVQFFSPNNPNKLNNITQKLESATISLDIAMYALTNIDLINSIIKCYNNKVKIRIILDYRMTEKYSYFLKELLRNNIPIKTNDNPEENMHHKFAIIDNKYIFDGSLNWSNKGVSKSHENILLLENEQIVREFSSQFDELWNKFKNKITLYDIEKNGKFFSEKKILPKQYYRHYNRYRNYFDRNGYNQEQFVEDDEHYEDEEYDESDSEEEEEEENDYGYSHNYYRPYNNRKYYEDEYEEDEDDVYDDDDGYDDVYDDGGYDNGSYDDYGYYDRVYGYGGYRNYYY